MVVYDEEFEQGAEASTTATQAWENFLASLTGTYTHVTISGSVDPTGIRCSDPYAVNELARALNTNTAVSVRCNDDQQCVSRYWNTGSCINSLELNSLNFNTVCTCPNMKSTLGYIVRPKMGTSNPNWGGTGITGNACSQESQNLRVVFHSLPTPSPTGSPTSLCPPPVPSGTPVVFEMLFEQGKGATTAAKLAWDCFLASLTGTTYSQVTISGSEDPTGVTCSDPTVVAQLAIALNTNAAVSVQCNSRSWNTGICSGSSLEFNSVLPGETGVCSNYCRGSVVRPGVGGANPYNPNWGGTGDGPGTACVAVTQTIRVEFS